MSTPGTFRDLVVIGASAGGVEALRTLVSHLPVDLPAAVLVVLHLPAGSTSVLATILDDAGPLPAEPARHGAPILRGRVYVAPPDRHLMVDGGYLILSSGPTENGHRPAVNALFRSAALARGPLVAGVVLSGVLDDGTSGLASIKSCGGLTIVQDPDEAAYRGMPESALASLDVDHVLTAEAIGTQLAKFLDVPIGAGLRNDPDPQLRHDNDMARGESGGSTRSGLGASDLVCPDCDAELSILQEERQQFHCKAGHTWSAGALLATADQQMQAALWTALRTLEEKAVLAEQMEATALRRGSRDVARRYAATVHETRAAARMIRKRLISGPSGDH